MAESHKCLTRGAKTSEEVDLALDCLKEEKKKEQEQAQEQAQTK